MEGLTHLFGTCACQRNQYTIVIPPSSASLAQVILDNSSAANRRCHTSLLPPPSLSHHQYAVSPPPQSIPSDTAADSSLSIKQPGCASPSTGTTVPLSPSSRTRRTRVSSGHSTPPHPLHPPRPRQTRQTRRKTRQIRHILGHRGLHRLREGSSAGTAARNLRRGTRACTATGAARVLEEGLSMWRLGRWKGRV